MCGPSKLRCLWYCWYCRVCKHVMAFDGPSDLIFPPLVRPTPRQPTTTSTKNAQSTKSEEPSADSEILAYHLGCCPKGMIWTFCILLITLRVQLLTGCQGIIKTYVSMYIATWYCRNRFSQPGFIQYNFVFLIHKSRCGEAVMSLVTQDNRKLSSCSSKTGLQTFFGTSLLFLHHAIMSKIFMFGTWRFPTISDCCTSSCILSSHIIRWDAHLCSSS